MRRQGCRAFAFLLPFSLDMTRFLSKLLLIWMLACSAWAGTPYSKPQPAQLTKDGRRWAAQTLKKLSLEEKVGQILNVRYFTDFQNFESDNYRQFRDQMRKYHI